nr:MAG TPA: hypothetical protein [Caudoviricetes sp.]
MFLNKKLSHRNVSCTSKYCESIDIVILKRLFYSRASITTEILHIPKEEILLKTSYFLHDTILSH